MQEIIVATKNTGKLREIRELLRDFPLKVTSLADYSGLPDVVEDGTTFQSNAVKKALTIAGATGKLTMGEDSGLEVKALGNRPGVYSARFSGEDATDQKNNAKLLRMLRDIPLEKRRARYRCCAVLAKGHQVLAVVEGSCGGLIAERGKGKNGFGYDPLFLIPRYKKTFGELPFEIKSRISHRARALKKLRASLQGLLGI